ncbi:hypothetical protein K458DRAFT_441266 [Lentithecium fluviatile CBS 122367]|uniref:Uncharacterized protein n=1 Tax=Lentithecium fluviatile CBS 122367 TaxID=1168545 RepID=A0A6G1JBJ9_9PLEO|nr:hypothetical protein K458DRAFT_441266 [Lentithecium fluviatile CBS 122367]
MELSAVSNISRAIDKGPLGTAVSISEVICRFGLRRRHDACSSDVKFLLGSLSPIYRKVTASSPVLGRLLDKAEEFDLADLNGLCAAVGDVYKPSAKLTIISDGLVYNVWAYGDALCSWLLKKTEGTCLTHCGYIKFLETYLRHAYPIGNGQPKSKFKTGTGYISKQLLRRGDNFCDHLRLFIHPSTDETSLSISPFPTSIGYMTPWRCNIAFGTNGSVTTMPREDSDSNPAYELICGERWPSYYRETSEPFNWISTVMCESLYPCMEATKVRYLAEPNSPIILRGLSQTRDRGLFVKKSEEFGMTLPGKMQMPTDSNVLSSEWIPFHFDGLFKTKKQILEDGSEKLVQNLRRYQFFTSVTPSPKDTCFTLVTPSRLVFQRLPEDIPLSRLSELTRTVSICAFDATTMTDISLVVPHLTTRKPCLHYHEPVVIDRVNESESTSICNITGIDSLLHDRRNCHFRAWENGDILVSANITAMHTRSDFASGATREQ